MTQATPRWNLQGDYFENCNCDIVCPCLFSPGEPLTTPPTQGYCDVGLAFHIDRGAFGGVSLDGLNVVAVAHADGPMGGGNWSLALYLDQRGSEQQREALQTIFSGAAGGPMAVLAPLIGNVLGVKPAPIAFTKDGRRRSVQIPNVMQMAVEAIPSLNPDGEIWVSNAHPINMEKLALAKGAAGSTFSDYGMRWDNSGKNGHYAAISWSGG